MTFWLDVHVPPSMVPWFQEHGHAATSFEAQGWLESPDPVIFQHLGTTGNVIVSKDADFADLVFRSGPPPQVLWLRCCNASNRRLRALLEVTFDYALALLEAGEPVVEIG